ncbi:MutS-related protein [Actinokineospora pegani]|uniref:MutS-related protein n=1 Tax=Actinokineospora pegani TaxID=2654637 RepID=UPI0012EAC9F4|nr:DNA mismatch repair protein MutS [Actinokineospora pegani]
MRPLLLFPDGDLVRDPADEHPADEHPADEHLVADLRLDVVWDAMSRGDEHVRAIARRVLLDPLRDTAVIDHRQSVLADFLAHPAELRALHQLADTAVRAEQALPHGRGEGLLRRSVRVLEVASDHLRALRDSGGRFTAPPLVRLFAELRERVGEAYLGEVAAVLRGLRFEDGIVVGARLGDGPGQVHYRVHEPGDAAVLKRLRKSVLRHRITGHDEQDWGAMAAFRNEVLGDIAAAVTESAAHVTGYFRVLRAELSFYLGCLNLAEELAGPTCWPDPDAASVTARGLWEPCLALWSREAVVGNDIATDGLPLVVVTGANRGGKSTFLRSLGLAQVMAQAGMFVCAEAFAAPPAPAVLTHFTRAEDRSMASGRLDEELGRMSAVVDRARPGALLLSNESFASTTDHEGAEIAEGVFGALVDSGVRVVAVTHLHLLAERLHRTRPGLFLVAGGGFRVVPGVPTPSAQATALYDEVMGR